MSAIKVNESAIKASRRGAKFLAVMTACTTFLFLFLAMGVDVFVLKATAEPAYSIWWWLFWAVASVLTLLCIGGAIGLIYALFSANISAVVDDRKNYAYLVIGGVLLTGVASFMIRTYKNEDLRALEARAVAGNDPAYQGLMNSKEQLQKEVRRINTDRRLDNDHLIPGLQSQISGIDAEMAKLSNQFAGEARLAETSAFMMILACIVSLVVDIAYSFCVQKGWGKGYYTITQLKQQTYDGKAPTSPSKGKEESQFSHNGGGNGQPEKKNSMNNKGKNGRKTQKSNRQKRIEKLNQIFASGRKFQYKKDLANEVGVTTETLDDYLAELGTDFSVFKNIENAESARQFDVSDKKFHTGNSTQNAVSETKTISIAKNELVENPSTGLTWQYSGPEKMVNYENAKKYIFDLNRDNYAGFSDWRLPTLEEAQSLNFADFDPEQNWIWTANKKDDHHYWAIQLESGQYYYQYWNDRFYVKAVR
jgi:uncharacterized membrane protein